MKALGKKVAIRGMKAVAYGTVGALTMFLVIVVYIMNRKADLKVWHTAVLDEEFTASSSVGTFTEYLDLEERLFAQLEQEVVAKVAPEDQIATNRYHRGSMSDPGRWPHDWNRSFELTVDPVEGKPKAGVLLIHGLSDSPYSLRVIGKRLHAEGAHVLGLRVPGHGTAPSALTRTKWQDMAAAVTLAVRRVDEQSGGQPLHLVGYSNGGALALRYALSALEDPALPQVDGMILISPEIGVSAMAGLAIWQERVGRITGLKKLAWTDVLPEYDPFKYGSFPVNAGNLAHELTGVNRSALARLSSAGKLDDFPRVLAFQSAVDATVSAPALVRDLFARLPERGHELVVFDLNRMVEIEHLLKKDPKAEFGPLRDDPNRKYTISLVGNASDRSAEAVVRQWQPRESEFTRSDTGLSWPAGIYSLSHLALPFRDDDPAYGSHPPEDSPGIRLGALAMRGERGVLQVSASAMLRLRWNPFYPYLEERVLEHVRESQP